VTQAIGAESLVDLLSKSRQAVASACWQKVGANRNLPRRARDYVAGAAPSAEAVCHRGVVPGRPQVDELTLQFSVDLGPGRGARSGAGAGRRMHPKASRTTQSSEQTSQCRGQRSADCRSHGRNCAPMHLLSTVAEKPSSTHFQPHTVAVLSRVATLLLDDLAMFEFGVVCEVFGIDRTDDGLPAIDFRVCGEEAGWR